MHVSFLEADQVLKEGFPAVHYTILVCFIRLHLQSRELACSPGPGQQMTTGKGKLVGVSFPQHTVALFSLARHCVLRPKPKSE